jgi:hypothetical protein
VLVISLLFCNMLYFTILYDVSVQVAIWAVVTDCVFSQTMEGFILDINVSEQVNTDNSSVMYR